MKRRHILFLTFFSICLLGAIISCDDDDTSGPPVIDYVRLTDSEVADSFITAANQGTLIAIVGENLGGAVEVWFNDQMAVLTPTYISDHSILVRVPNDVPMEITNTITILFEDGSTLSYNFEVSISAPQIISIDNEYALEGSQAIIRGNFFYEPVTVLFTGGVEAEIVDMTEQLITIVVPEGAESGQIEISSGFGSTKSDFIYKDGRNIVISSDPFTGWWDGSNVVYDPGANDPPKINGNYIRFKTVLGSWDYKEVVGGPPDAMGEISKNIPDDAILNPEDYNLKFEMNTLKPYNGSILRLNFGLASDFNYNAFQWQPPFDTGGKWQTVIIPYEDLMASYIEQGITPAVSANGYFTRVLFQGPGVLDADICFDNFRIVPKDITPENDED